jgi:hypothetical protein
MYKPYEEAFYFYNAGKSQKQEKEFFCDFFPVWLHYAIFFFLELP